MTSIKIITFFATVIFISKHAHIIHASSTPPAPTCQIEGQITEINSTLNNTEVALTIDKISTFEAVDFNWIKCDEEYKSRLSNTKITYLETKTVPLKKTMKIRGLVHYGGDERGSATVLSAVEILSQPVNKTNFLA